MKITGWVTFVAALASHAALAFENPLSIDTAAKFYANKLISMAKEACHDLKNARRPLPKGCLVGHSTDELLAVLLTRPPVTPLERMASAARNGGESVFEELVKPYARAVYNVDGLEESADIYSDASR